MQRCHIQEMHKKNELKIDATQPLFYSGTKSNCSVNSKRPWPSEGRIDFLLPNYEVRFFKPVLSNMSQIYSNQIIFWVLVKFG